MTVIARDNGVPSLQSQNSATVTINVIRNNQPPVFQNTPYVQSVSQSTTQNTPVFQVTATDADVVSLLVWIITPCVLWQCVGGHLY